MLESKKFRALFENQLTEIRTWFYICVGDAVDPKWGARVTEWQQFIGLPDITGREIYDGDILKDDKGKLYEIKWGNDLLWLAITNENHSNCYCPRSVSKRSEVVGNISENPELFKTA